MKVYSLLFLKKMFKRKGNWVPISLLFLLTLISLGVNTKVLDHTNFIKTIKSEINSNWGTKEEQEMRKEAFSAYQKGEYKKTYDYMIARVERRLEGSPAGGSELTVMMYNIVLRDSLVFQRLKELNVKADSQEHQYTQGVNFTLFFLQALIPFLFVIFFLFLLATGFTENYKENIDKRKLLPLSRGKIVLSELGASSAGILSLFLLTFLFAFGSASLLNGVGSLRYPIGGYTLSAYEPQIVSAGDVLWKSGILMVLFLIFNVFLLYFLSFWIKTKMNLFLISLLLIVGGNVLATRLVQLFPIAQFLPMSYLSAVSIVTGNFQKGIQNAHVSFEMGLVVLLVSIGVLSFLIALKVKFPAFRVSRLEGGEYERI